MNRNPTETTVPVSNWTTILFASLISFLISPLSPTQAEEIPQISGIVDQRDFPDSINACGPAAILNLLKFSRPEHQEIYRGLLGSEEGVRMRFLVDRYFRNRPSVVYPKQRRWGVHGIQSADLVTGLNELLEDNGAASLKAVYLDRKEGEGEKDHLVRCHDLISTSVGKGVLPILSLRSFLVKKGGDEPEGWESGFHHNVVVREVAGPPTSIGFELIALDPYRARSVELFVHREGNGQQFRALKGVEETGEWLRGTPFLQVLSPEVPTVRPRDLKWSDRYVLVANFLIGDF